ncbi:MULTISPECIES: hypothetical protein [Escherichia]|uniref:hypothetical protein n=1 Tax=Escherichia TaxID=561 RepID=UPI0007E376D6|nr:MULTISPECIES: hypothetical protein [Escherichia]MEB7938947.1 hypothetical protein [Escherichia whittamii]MEC9493532.1 hypothetical protein [Escherichia whittamii]MEC9558015.1 hypothetical protein [Escherichia whittamii]QLX44283.1 hypothetical protein HV146_09500 [Escherichia coli]
MTQLKKKWVFKELVTSGDDAQELMAYAIYKVKKNQLAEARRSQGWSEEKIQEELDKFHEITLQVGLEDYRSKAQALFLEVMQGAAEHVTPYYEKEIEKLKKEHDEAIKRLNSQIKDLRNNAVKHYIEKVEEYNLSQKTWQERYLIRPIKWAFSGLPGIFASAFTLGVIVAIMGYFAGPEKRTLIIYEGAKNILEILAPNKLIPGMPELSKKEVD